jgi:hypothetical protein
MLFTCIVEYHSYSLSLLLSGIHSSHGYLLLLSGFISITDFLLFLPYDKFVLFFFFVVTLLL